MWKLPLPQKHSSLEAKGEKSVCMEGDINSYHTEPIFRLLIFRCDIHHVCHKLAARLHGEFLVRVQFVPSVFCCSFSLSASPALWPLLHFSAFGKQELARIIIQNFKKQHSFGKQKWFGSFISSTNQINIYGFHPVLTPSNWHARRRQQYTVIKLLQKLHKL